MDSHFNWCLCLESIKTHYIFSGSEPGPFFGQGLLFPNLCREKTSKSVGIEPNWEAALFDDYGCKAQVCKSSPAWCGPIQQDRREKVDEDEPLPYMFPDLDIIGKIHGQLQNQQSFWQSVSGGMDIIPNWNATINLL